MEMYEKIVELPLFKGLSRDEVNDFVGRTALSFSRHAAGETIAAAGQPVTSVKCLLSGSVSLSGLSGTSVTVGAGSILGLDRLYGLDTTYGCEITALEPVALMEFSKSALLEALQSNQLILINMLNYLCREIWRERSDEQPYQ